MAHPSHNLTPLNPLSKPTIFRSSWQRYSNPGHAEHTQRPPSTISPPAAAYSSLQRSCPAALLPHSPMTACPATADDRASLLAASPHHSMSTSPCRTPPCWLSAHLQVTSNQPIKPLVVVITATSMSPSLPSACHRRHHQQAQWSPGRAPNHTAATAPSQVCELYIQGLLFDVVAVAESASFNPCTAARATIKTYCGIWDLTSLQVQPCNSSQTAPSFLLGDSGRPLWVIDGHARTRHRESCTDSHVNHREPDSRICDYDLSGSNDNKHVYALAQPRHKW